MIALLVLAAAAGAVIPRVDQGNIQAWQVPDARTVYLQDRANQWYRADMRGPCVILNFNEQLGFRTGPGGRLDSTSQIVSRGGRCPIRSLIAVDGPPPTPQGRR